VSESGFTLTATGGGLPGCPASSFTITGANYTPGCGNGDGTWTNNLQEEGSFTWNNGGNCPIPDYEQNPTGGWELVNGAIYDWNVVVGSYTGELFGGRTVMEVDTGNGSDSCHFNGSAYPENNAIPNPASWVVDWNESYVDAVGWYNNEFFYYRNQRQQMSLPLPYGFQWNQNMRMACNGGSFSSYYYNYLNGTIYTDQAGSYRGIYGQTRLY
jgi:hypothetical protein